MNYSEKCFDENPNMARANVAGEHKLFPTRQNVEDFKKEKLVESERKISANRIESLREAIFDIRLETGKESQLKIFGRSMWPLINNDVVVVNHVRDGIGIGTIVAYKKDHILIVHRVVQRKKKRNKTTYITKGDFNYTFDSEISQEELLGKITTIKKGKLIIELDNKWECLGALIAVCSYCVGILCIGVIKFIKFCRNIGGK